MTIWFASGNVHKKDELAAILGRELKIPADSGLDFDPAETGFTFLENSFLKARALRLLLEEKRPSSYQSGDPIIADDSGLCVDALNGRPGIYSARYGMMSDTKVPDTKRNALLLTELGDNPLRTARFVCAMVLYYSEDRFFAAQETLEGEIVSGINAARGSGGFGYDPILFIPELSRTAAELSPEEKNSISHRGKAGKALGRFLN